MRAGRERKQQKCIGRCLRTDDELIYSLWVRSREQTSAGNVVVSVCYRLPDQEEVNEVFFIKLEEAPHLQFFMGNFNHLISAFRNPRPLKPVGKPGIRKTDPQQRNIKLANLNKWTYAGLWGLMGCTHKC